LDRILQVDPNAITDACVLNDTCGTIMLPEQAELAAVLDQRRRWLADLVADVVRPL
jgi:hypothetical protein